MELELSVGSGRGPAVWMLGAFVVVFLATRVVVRMIRAGRGPFRDASVGGVHVHHVVYGVFAMLVAGVGEFVYRPGSPWVEALAVLFGTGAALTLDEFALWLRLEDVYWSAQGRLSVDAVVVAAAAMALLVLGANPFDPDSGAGALAVALGVGTCVALVVVALLKGRIVLGLLGVLAPVLALVGALRLARPGSPWARWCYPPRSTRAARSLARFPSGRRTRWDVVLEAVAGRPDLAGRPPRPSTSPPNRDDISKR